jgi:hypothetical protein
MHSAKFAAYLLLQYERAPVNLRLVIREV